MQQRRLRLGDILDDYCPRERRITNHAVVAMIEEQVKQTRCTTCDADHEYKGGRAPSARRRKDAGGLAEMLEGPRAVRPADSQPSAPVAHAEADASELSDDLELEPLEDAIALADVIAEEDEPSDVRDDDGPVHRPLIRATLPRPEGHVPERKEPEFTVRQSSGGRGGDGNRGGGQSHGGQGGGFGGGGQRPGRNRRHGRPGGAGAGQNSANGQQRFGAPRQGGPQRNGSGQGAGRGPQDANRPPGPHGPGRVDQRNPGRKRGR